MKKTVILILHISYWLLFLLLQLFVLFLLVSTQGVKSKETLLTPLFFKTWAPTMLGFTLLPGGLAFYSFYTFLFNRFLLNKKIFKLTAYGLLTCLLSALAGALSLSLIFFGPRFLFASGWQSAKEIYVLIAFGALINGIIGLVLRGFITSYQDIKVKDELNSRNHEMELALINARLNPHFLFNTINNIDTLIQMDSVKASLYLNQLSDIMRFTLYETQAPLILLRKELDYIEKYLALQKIRTANQHYILFTFSGDPADILIPPMLFLPFIENAFKYAQNKKDENAVKIKITISPGHIFFECDNSYMQKNGPARLHPGGLGNQLIIKRLELLYPDQHSLSITDTGSRYTVQLSCSLKERL